MLNVLSGTTARHNKTLREVRDWTGTVQKFLSSYDLYGSTDYSTLLGNIGDAKFDLTALAYNGRPLITKAGRIKGQEIEPLIIEIITSVENLRRYLIHPSLQSEKVSNTVLNLRSSYENLQETLTTIELM